MNKSILSLLNKGVKNKRKSELDNNLIKHPGVLTKMKFISDSLEIFPRAPV